MTGRGALICGVDEAGRGPLAGPVYAAAVILDQVTNGVSVRMALMYLLSGSGERSTLNE